MTPLDLLELCRRGPVHFMGIAGAGMTPLAELLLGAGGRVTGCDAHPSSGIHRLEAAGASVVVGHDPAHIDGCAALVVTAAVAPDHPEIAAARQRGIPVLKRAEALGGIVNRGLVVGISGTHGKTTTTAMTTAVLAAAGHDPTGFVGARVSAWGGNLRPGGDHVYVVEADEYDRSFLTLRPRIAVVTTLEADHLDIYGNLDAIEDAFAEFISAVPEDGLVIGCGDDGGVARLLTRVPANRPVVTYGTGAGTMVRAEDLRSERGGTRFVVRERGTRLGEAHVSVPGLHNVRNTLAAIAVARQIGAEWTAIRDGIESYKGVERRFETVGEAAGVLLVDDYAHHPTEVAATLQAARAAYPDRRIVAIFQPHLYSRTRDFAPEFGRALTAADRVLVTDVYAAREKPITGITGALVADAASAAGADVRYVADRTAVPRAALEELRSGDLCLTMGAGNLDAAARDVIAALGALSPSR